MVAILFTILGMVGGDDGTVRFATFNASLNRDSAGELIRDLSGPDNVQARNVAEIIQRTAPDVLLINEFDHDPDGKAAALFQDNYLAVGQNGARPIRYAHRFSAAVNTGEPTGFDLDQDGQVVQKPGSRGYGNDAHGFGQFPGQYGMVVYSRYPIDVEKARSFRLLRWNAMPGGLLPTKPDGSPWYSAEALATLRLSSKSHWDLPLSIGSRTVHLLVSHPTPPAFDGAEKRNSRRNHDEIRLWADYLTGGESARYIHPDRPGPVDPPRDFVLMGDQNSDPNDGASVPGAIQQLLNHPRIQANRIPISDGARAASQLQAGANRNHRGPAEQDTADFDDRSAGNLRVDYVLPSKTLESRAAGVFWPEPNDPLARLVTMKPTVASSDHRLVWLDLVLETPNPR